MKYRQAQKAFEGLVQEIKSQASSLGLIRKKISVLKQQYGRMK